MNGEYRFVSLCGFSIDTDIVNCGRRVASSDNRLEIPSRTVVGIGARQRFKLMRAEATLRVHVGNRWCQAEPKMMRDELIALMGPPTTDKLPRKFSNVDCTP